MQHTSLGSRLSHASALLFYSSGFFLALAAIGYFFLSSIPTAMTFAMTSIIMLSSSAVIYRYKLGLTEAAFQQATQNLPTTNEPVMNPALLSLINTAQQHSTLSTSSDDEHSLSIQESCNESSLEDESEIELSAEQLLR